MMLTIWGASSAWTLTALPLFLWMGEILFRSKLSDSMFRGLAPWMDKLPGRLLHTNVVGCTILRDLRLVGGHLRHDRQDDLARAAKARLSRRDGRGHAGWCGHAGAAHSAVDHHDRVWRGGQRFDCQAVSGGRVSRADAGGLFMGYIAIWALFHRDQVPASDMSMTFAEDL